MPAARGPGPGWLLGPYGEGLGVAPAAYLALLAAAFAAYLACLFAAPALAPRPLAAAVVLLVGAFALAPPLLSEDVFSYISYARLDARHGLNPYDAVPSQAPGDAAYRHVGWSDSVSAYGPLFSLLTRPLGAIGVAPALWLAKALAALSLLGVAALTARLAAARGADPRRAAAFVALNPLVLVHVVGGAHNDALMMLLVLAGCAAVLLAAEGAAGAALVAAAAVKASAAFAAPFALLGARRRGRFAAAAVAAACIVAVAAVAVYGGAIAEALGLVGENQALTTFLSLPSIAARTLGADVDAVRSVALVVYAIAYAALLAWTWRGGDWLRAAGWAGLGLLLATSWLLPWYLVWVLPLAAVARDPLLAGGVLALSAFHLGTRLPL